MLLGFSEGEMMEPRLETVQADAAGSFRSKWISCASFAADHTWHYHPEFELSWIVRSRGTRFIGDNIEPYHTGDLVLLGPNLPHCWHDEREADCGESQAVVVQFRPEMFGHDFMDLPEFQPIKRLFRAAKCGLQVRGPTAVQAQSLLLDLLQKTGLSRLTGLLEILRVLAEGEADLRPLASIDYHLTNDITEVNRQRIEAVHRHVREHLCDDINQAEVARLVGLTPPAFSRFFRKATGQTFVGFVNILRINEVCRAMTESADCITQIALSCGYNNIANFNRQFLAVKGMNPSQYREQHQRLQHSASQFQTG
jgi:AraC-like DNA-binding protein